MLTSAFLRIESSGEGISGITIFFSLVLGHRHWSGAAYSLGRHCFSALVGCPSGRQRWCSPQTMSWDGSRPQSLEYFPRVIVYWFPIQTYPNCKCVLLGGVFLWIQDSPRGFRYWMWVLATQASIDLSNAFLPCVTGPWESSKTIS